jgi:hypothetical protein
MEKQGHFATDSLAKTYIDRIVAYRLTVEQVEEFKNRLSLIKVYIDKCNMIGIDIMINLMIKTGKMQDVSNDDFMSIIFVIANIDTYKIVSNITIPNNLLFIRFSEYALHNLITNNVAFNLSNLYYTFIDEEYIINADNSVNIGLNNLAINIAVLWGATQEERQKFGSYTGEHMLIYVKQFMKGISSGMHMRRPSSI